MTPAKIAKIRSALDEMEVASQASLRKPGAQHSTSGGPTVSKSKRRASRPWRPPPPARLQGLGPLSAVRCKLPVTQHRAQVLEALQHPVSIVEADTGSGKTTQVAQFLLETAAKAGRSIKIACTQPRRLSAIGVAERIAEERGEPVGKGGAVGYAVRGESNQSPANSLLVCTVGVLLRIMEETDPTLAGFDVIIVDEVHERSVENDLLLLALRRILTKQERERKFGRGRGRRGGGRGSGRGVGQSGRGAAPTNAERPPKLRVCLMSATIDGALFEDYFRRPLRLKRVPRVRFGGRSFPVSTYYLEDALEMTSHVVRPSAEWCLHSEAARRRCVEQQMPQRPVVTRSEMAQRFPNRSARVLDALRVLDSSVVNVDLIVQLLRRSLMRGGETEDGEAEPRGTGGGDASGGYRTPEGGSVLVFLPGTVEIDEVSRAVVGMLARPDGRVRREWVLPLHGALPPSEQARCFLAAPEGVCKIVLATNVAETSITIPDVAMVIDSGRVKQTAYEPSRRMASLADVRVSAAQARQREGRAGRVRDGVCFHLYPSDADLEPQTEPEVRRVSLERLIMSTKALRLPGRTDEILSQLPEPPEPVAAAVALRDLSLIGAISAHNEALTPLGNLLVELPIEPRLAKLILLGVCFGAIDEALTIAAALSSSRSPFLAPVEAMEARTMDAARRSLAKGTQSDHIAVLNAYRTYFLLPIGGDDARAAFAARCYLSPKVLESMRTLKAQLLGILYDAKLVTRNFRSLAFVEDFAFRKAAERNGLVAALADAASARGGEREGALPSVPTSGPSAGLLGGLVAAAFYPQVAFVHARSVVEGGRRGKKATRRDDVELHIRDARWADSPIDSNTGRAVPPARATAASPKPIVARVHPSSVCSRLNGSGWDSPYLAFHDCSRTRRLFVRDVTPVPPLALLLFSGDGLEVSDAPTGKDITLDGWLVVELSANAADLLADAREHVRARWERMVVAASAGTYSNERRLAWASGRFDGQILLDAVQPLLEQKPLRAALAAPTADSKKKRSDGGRGTRVTRKPTRRRQRSRMARYRFDNRAGKYV